MERAIAVHKIRNAIEAGGPLRIWGGGGGCPPDLWDKNVSIPRSTPETCSTRVNPLTSAMNAAQVNAAIPCQRRPRRMRKSSAKPPNPAQIAVFGNIEIPSLRQSVKRGMFNAQPMSVTN